MEDNMSIETTGEKWIELPENVVFHIFSYMSPRELLNCSQVCRLWYRVAKDEFLWKELLYKVYSIDRAKGITPGKSSWLEEFKSLYYDTPVIESEAIVPVPEHIDEIYHISFSHNGQMFAVTSANGFLMVNILLKFDNGSYIYFLLIFLQ